MVTLRKCYTITASRAGDPGPFGSAVFYWIRSVASDIIFEEHYDTMSALLGNIGCVARLTDVEFNIVAAIYRRTINGANTSL